MCVYKRPRSFLRTLETPPSTPRSVCGCYGDAELVCAFLLPLGEVRARRLPLHPHAVQVAAGRLEGLDASAQTGGEEKQQRTTVGPQQEHHRPAGAARGGAGYTAHHHRDHRYLLPPCSAHTASLFSTLHSYISWFTLCNVTECIALG